MTDDRIVSLVQRRGLVLAQPPAPVLTRALTDADYTSLLERANQVGYMFTQMDRLIMKTAALRPELWAWLRHHLMAMGYKPPDLNQIAPPPVPQVQPRSFRKLHHKLLPDLIPIVPDIIYPGLTGLFGPPKVGKGWIIYDVIQAVAAGSLVFGRETTRFDTLYITLEDSERRAKLRMHLVTGGNEPPANCHFLLAEDLVFEGQMLTLGNGFEEALEYILNTNPNIGLVVLDTLGRVTGNQGRGEASYNFDVKNLGKLHMIANKRQIAIVFVHHTRKAKGGDDPFDAILGTTGIRGTVDHSILLLRPNAKDLSKEQYELDLEDDPDDAMPNRPPARLLVEGRDLVKPVDISLIQDPATCRWVDNGRYRDSTDQGQERLSGQIIDFVRKKGALNRQAIVGHFEGYSSNSIDLCLKRAVRHNKLANAERGMYTLPVPTHKTGLLKD